MSTGFLYVFLALVLHSNSSGSVLALLGKKIPKHLWRKRHWCVVKYHKQFSLNISSWRLHQGQRLLNFMLQLSADCLRSAHMGPAAALWLTPSHNYTLRSGWILGVDLTCIKVYLTLEKKGFLLLIRLLFFFLIPGRVFIFIMLNADFSCFNS